MNANSVLFEMILSISTESDICDVGTSSRTCLVTIVFMSSDIIEILGHTSEHNTQQDTIGQFSHPST